MVYDRGVLVASNCYSFFKMDFAILVKDSEFVAVYSILVERWHFDP